MSLRIPLTPDQTLQTEFHEIERRLRKLEKATGVGINSSRVLIAGSSGTGTVNLQPIFDRLNDLEAAIAGLPDPITTDFGAVGPTSVHGLVPAPGVTEPPPGVAEHVVKEDGEWGFPFRGLVQVLSPGTASGTGSDSLNVEGSLGVNGDLSAHIVDAKQVRTIDGVSLEGDSYQVTSLQRGLVATATEGSQTEPPYDVVNVNGGLHVGSVMAATIEVGDLHVYGELDLDGGVP